MLFKSEFEVGKDIKDTDISEFYFTRENINYDAFYQRYRFYTEDGKHMFFHETRERKNDYGPATEKDRTAMGTLELSEEEWKRFYELVSGGTVTARRDSAESGGSGPWLYLYWTKDKSKYQEYSFVSYERENEFEAFCVTLAQGQSGTPGDAGGKAEKVEKKYGDLESFSYHPGYCDMDGSSHYRCLKKEDGEWIIESRDRENLSEPVIITVYAVAAEAVADFEIFLYEKDVFSLQDREKSDDFITDYSAWNISIDLTDRSGDKPERRDFSFDEYRQYSDEDRQLIKELKERFEKLKGEVLSETEEED